MIYTQKIHTDLQINTLDYKVTFLYLFVKSSNTLGNIEYNVDISKC